jgi:putative aldouronate transport system substrate-binding protein
VKYKKFLALALACILAFCMGCTGCSDSASPDSSSREENLKPEPSDQTDHLIYYTIGAPDPDLGLVNDEINRILKEKINVTIQYNKIPWEEYGQRIAALINSGSDFDIMFASAEVDEGDYIGYAQNGAWLPLDEYLVPGASGYDMYQAIDKRFWDGVKVDGKIYGIPTNKELAVPLWWMYPKELVDKYDIDITKYRTLESLEPLFQMIQRNEPDYIVFELDKKAHNFFLLDGYDWIIDKDCPLMVKNDDDLQVVSIFETEYGRDTLDTLHRYYEAGYINNDAAVNDNGSLVRDRKTFLKVAAGGPTSEVAWSNDRGYPVVAQQVTKAYITPNSTCGGIMCVNARTKNAEACVQFLNLLNTDPELRNLVQYGIEGEHYTLDERNKVVLPQERTYTGIQYTQGNFFLLNLTQADPDDKWEQFQDFNEKAVPSSTLGFVADRSEISDELNLISNVSQKYWSNLITGTVDPQTELPKFIHELKLAGLDKVKEELQRQLDDFKQSKSPSENP